MVLLPNTDHGFHSHLLLFVDLAQEIIVKIHAVAAGPGLENPQILTDKSFSNEPFASRPVDFAIRAYASLDVAGGITRRHWAAIHPRRRTIHARRGGLRQGFVGAFVIVFPAPPVEPPLLTPAVARHRRKGFGFQGPMHSLVRAILFRMPWIDELRRDPQAHPPHRQTAQSRCSARAEGGTVIHSNPGRLPFRFEQSLKNRQGLLIADVRASGTAKNIARAKIAHRQRFAALTVPKAEPTFEINSPDVVRR